MKKEIKVLPCPFCGAEYDGYDGVISIGEEETPDAWWDSGLRGESFGFVTCYRCGVILKANDVEDAVKKWNQRSKK